MRTAVVIREEHQGLEWVVQVRHERGGWESMAAFNAKSVAEHYAEDCKKTNRHLRYRVIELSAIQPTHAIILEI